jgi:hypothetical protein
LHEDLVKHNVQVHGATLGEQLRQSDEYKNKESADKAKSPLGSGLDKDRSNENLILKKEHIH